MKTETLMYFQYQNAATTYFVKATEYQLPTGIRSWRMTVIDGETVTRFGSECRSDAIKHAEIVIAQFVARMHMIYNV